jgi:hypothetical protein
MIFRAFAGTVSGCIKRCKEYDSDLFRDKEVKESEETDKESREAEGSGGCYSQTLGEIGYRLL